MCVFQRTYFQLIFCFIYASRFQDASDKIIERFLRDLFYMVKNLKNVRKQPNRMFKKYVFFNHVHFVITEFNANPIPAAGQSILQKKTTCIIAATKCCASEPT